MYSGWPFEKGCWDFSVEMLMIIFPSIWPDYGIDRDKHFGKQVSQTFDVPQTCRLTWNNDLKFFSRFGKLFGVHKHSTKSSVWLAVHSGAVNTRFSFFLWQSDATVSTDYCHRMQFVQQSVNRSQRLFAWKFNICCNLYAITFQFINQLICCNKQFARSVVLKYSNLNWVDNSNQTV